MSVVRPLPVEGRPIGIEPQSELLIRVQLRVCLTADSLNIVIKQQDTTRLQFRLGTTAHQSSSMLNAPDNLGAYCFSATHNEEVTCARSCLVPEQSGLGSPRRYF
jgi:hypothetical protein